MGGGSLGVIVVRVCEPEFRNLFHSYTWPLKTNGPISEMLTIHTQPFDFFSHIVGT